MITEDYVSFEIAKLLNEKGFDEPCFAYYSEYWDNWKSFRFWKKFPKRNVPNKGYLNVPTLALVMKWLREVHKYFIEIRYSFEGEGECGYVFKIRKIGEDDIGIWSLNDELYSSYEDACKESIKYCLENLI